ncbi:MAG: 16S rRNA (cytidine(1402)-2'-O)-methyltransferase [Trueperaceae bacterium]
MSRLILVPTPIGAMRDLTLRAIDVLRDADVVAAEDTRRSGALLAHHGIDATLVRLDAHTVASRGPALLDAHDTVAYVSDAGTPGVSDPGADLLRLAIVAGHDVEVLPGPTAFVPALILSGLPVARFAYDGFLPRKGSDRKRRMQAIAVRDHPTALYESPHRLVRTLADLIMACGATRPASVSRELTKRFEETRRGTLQEVHDHFVAHDPRGEIVIIVGPAGASDAHPGASPHNDPTGDASGPHAGAAVDPDATATALRSVGIEGRTLRDALQALGVPRNRAYRAALRPDADGADPPDRS